jgi:hypothetical protein
VLALFGLLAARGAIARGFANLRPEAHCQS